MSSELYTSADVLVQSGGTLITAVVPGSYYIKVANNYQCSYTTVPIIIEPLEPLGMWCAVPELNHNWRQK
ncbi:MAG: hypothetical protein SH856_12975 [Flavobacteriales bacterium]|nr:hypothetical protein [Flavobacteriales bacterium]